MLLREIEELLRDVNMCSEHSTNKTVIIYQSHLRATKFIFCARARAVWKECRICARLVSFGQYGRTRFGGIFTLDPIVSSTAFFSKVSFFTF